QCGGAFENLAELFEFGSAKRLLRERVLHHGDANALAGEVHAEGVVFVRGDSANIDDQRGIRGAEALGVFLDDHVLDWTTHVGAPFSCSQMVTWAPGVMVPLTVMRLMYCPLAADGFTLLISSRKCVRFSRRSLSE